jgi:hypothetical protein
LELTRGLNGSLICANVFSGLLRSNFVAQQWRMHLANFIERNVSLFINLCKKSDLGPSILPACWATQLGRPIGLRGLIWDLGVVF